ncbi:MAG: undecaprenyl/decaprenyl-phosphate alpha-N-acetylglucosaminyl 1-phosphate transferase [Sphingobacteriales bacterium]|nr:MAG: undecaprenyl/decaprenyl-phosphate alpha-N-acetylglucosaminyl 1-phosphate transferase [Sphingobacteriales bacterium]
MHLPAYIEYLIAFATSLAISLFTIPQIIYIANRKRLFDLPDNFRKVHERRTISNLGGVGIFFAYSIGTSLFIHFFKNWDIYNKWNYIMAASSIFFLVGMTDDLIALRAMKKLSAQLVPVIIIIFGADIRIESFHGIFGVQELPYWFSVALTGSLYLFFTNAFNLIDGINWLAGSMGVLATFCFGVLLFLEGHEGSACIAFTMMGAIIGFLRYNITPARIFMGDTGSLLLGFTIIILCVMSLGGYTSGAHITALVHTPGAMFTMGVGVLSIPLFDCFRVFFSRLSKGKPPFLADRNHMHHYFLDLGFSHLQAVGAMIAGNIFLIIMAWLLEGLNPALAITILFLVASLLFFILRTARNMHLAKKEKLSLNNPSI